MGFDPKSVCLADDTELLLQYLGIHSAVELVMHVRKCTEAEAERWLLKTEESCQFCRMPSRPHALKGALRAFPTLQRFLDAGQSHLPR